MHSKHVILKIALILFLFSSTTVFSQMNFKIIPKVSLDVAGSHNVSALGKSGSLSVNTGYTLAIEFLRPIGERVDAGVGLMYLFPREQEVSGSGKFNFVTVYGAAVINLLEKTQNIMPSLVLNLGYNFIYTGDLYYTGGLATRGGIYWGAGLRINYRKLILEGLYKSFAGSVSPGMFSSDSNTLDVTYSTFSIGAGFIF